MRKNTLYFVFLFLFIFNFAKAEKYPIVYCEEYNFSLPTADGLHGFDTGKFGKIANYLVDKLIIDSKQFYRPRIAFQKDLELVHSSKYLSDLIELPQLVAKILELDGLDKRAQESTLIRMKYKTGGTITACRLALEKWGWAINLGGGYHHAKRDSGSGFCIYADIPIAVYKLWKKNKDLKVMIIDLDAHQGNGYADIFKDDKRISIFDIYVGNNYPRDYDAKKFIEYNHPVKRGICTKEYLKILNDHLPQAIETEKPDLIIYNAGSDILSGDEVGCMQASPEGLISRDELVFRLAFDNKIPIAMLLSGGYTQRSAEIIGESIVNLWNKVICK